MPDMPEVAAAAEGDVDRVAGDIGGVDGDGGDHARERQVACAAHGIDLGARPVAPDLSKR